MIEINKATNADIPDLSEMLGILFIQDIEFIPDIEKQKKGILLIINNPEVGQILVMKEHGQIIGMLNILFSVSTALGEKVAILEDMIIKPGKRGKGLGTKLLLKGISFAKDCSCKRITLLTDFNNSKAISFYEKLGFVKSDMIPLRMLF